MSGIKFTPWWHEAIGSAKQTNRQLPKSIDVVIVGSGYTGLSAALTLSRAGRSVLVLEARECGFGASTRNGGQVGSGNQKFTVQKLIDLYGRDKAKELINTGTEMFRYITDFIKTEKIDCHFQVTGRFRGAVQAKHYEMMAKDMEDLKRFAGVEFFMVPKAEQLGEVGTDCYHGGSVLPNDAALHPGLYHHGLLDRVTAAGAMVIDETPVTGVIRNKSTSKSGLNKPDFHVQTNRGTISAADVIIATNGYTGSALPAFKSRLVPIGSSVIATQELSDEVMRTIMPTGRVYGNTARVFHYYRPSPDGRRILFGGRVGRLSLANTSSAYEHLRKEMIKIFPSLSNNKITHCWSGNIAYTKDTLPHLGCHDGIWYAAGYCGTGVSRSTWFGHKVALKVLADAEGKTVFDDLPFSPFAFRWAAPLGVAAVETWYRIQDALSR